MIDSVQSTALQSMHKAASNIAKEAKQISRALITDPPKDIAKAIVNVIRESTQFNASGKLVKVANNMTKNILDILA